jgi:uncharacterized protein (DUF2384 family)
MRPVIVAVLALIAFAFAPSATVATPPPQVAACCGAENTIYSAGLICHGRWHSMTARTDKRVSRELATAEMVRRGPARAAGYFDKDGLIVIDRVAASFGVSKAQLADTMGVSPETFHRAARAKAPKTQGRVTEMVEIVARVSDWAGGERQALAWYRAEPLPAFGGRTAESLVKDGKAAAVRDWLDHVATGGFA